MPARTTPLKRLGTPRTSAARAAIKDPRQRLLKVMDLLESNLGVPVWDGPKNGLEVLVLTILSQNTNDLNALRAYQNLAAKYPAGESRTSALPRDAHGQIDKVQLRLSNAAAAVAPPNWAAVSALTEVQLAEHIRIAGLPGSKAASIAAVLRWLKPHGFSLERVMEQAGADATVAQMTGIKGVGVKTAAVTLIEACGADLCPVDTHVHRIINRLGIVQTKEARDKTFELLKAMIPKGRGYALHHNLLTFGRTVCTAKNPKCGPCVLRALCPSRQDAKATSRPRSAR